MQIGIPAEVRPGETRVAATPETVKKLAASGHHQLLVQSGAGVNASVPDEQFTAAGATIVATASEVFERAQIVLKVRAPMPNEVSAMKSGTIVIGLLNPYDGATVESYAKQGLTAFAMEWLPRTTRAQAMDVLSSQANIAGYKAVILAANEYQRFMPMLMTAAGTVKAARVLILGAGVAGLQAIATARRLGAVVTAYDVRAAAGEEVRSLGATFLDLELDTQEGEGGYARVQSEEFLARQRDLIGAQVERADIVVTTAAVPGRPAPLLVTADMVAAMRPGSVIVDLGADVEAAEGGGNCELTRAGETIEVNGVTILGPRNAASAYPLHASGLYARNVANLLTLLVRDGQMDPDWNDEIVAACCVTRDGEVQK